MFEIHRLVLVPLPRVLGVDLSITNEVLLLWISAGLTFLLLLLACRRRGPVARGWYANLFEAVIEIVDKVVVREGIGERGRRWSPFLLSLFFFILFSNLLALVPDPSHFKAATANINVTGALALLVFLVCVGINISRHGLLGFLRKFKPSGIPIWLTPVIVPIELVTWLMRPVSHAIRLFANMAAGHAIVVIFLSMAVTTRFLKPLPLFGAVAMSAFDIFGSFVQAFIFTMLAGVYIRDAIEEH